MNKNKEQQADLIEKNRSRAEKVIRLYMKELARPEKLEATPINQIASAMGTLIDKFGKKGEEGGGTIIVTHNIPRSQEGEG